MFLVCPVILHILKIICFDTCFAQMLNSTLADGSSRCFSTDEEIPLCVPPCYLVGSFKLLGPRKIFKLILTDLNSVMISVSKH